MPTITTVDATWDTGVNMDAAELRRADSTMFLGDGSNNGVRGGIVRHGDNSLAVSVNGSDQVTVQAGSFVIPAATGLGVYRGALQSSTAATALAARNGTNPRIDLIVIQATGSGATVKTIEGTAGASPSAPALPAQHIELARVTVPAVGGGAVTVDSTWRQYATAIGGTIYVETAAGRLPGSGNIKGQRAVALDTGMGHKWSGTEWVADYVSTNLGPANGNYTSNSTIERSGQTVTLNVDVGALINLPANADVLALPYTFTKEKIVWGIDNATGGAVALRITTGGLVRHILARNAGTVTVATITLLVP